MPVTSGPPTPTVPTVALPGFSFSQAINSCRSFAGKVFRATIHCGVSAIRETWFEILHHVVLKLITRAVQGGLCPVADADGVSIRSCSCDSPHADAAARP